MNISNTITFDKNNIDWNHLNNFQDIIVDGFVGSLIKQNCGDIFEVVDRIDEKDGNCALYKCKSLRFNFEENYQKRRILQGKILDSKFQLGILQSKEWKQNCGDSLIVLREIEYKKESYPYYECKFIKYPYVGIFRKDVIEKGKCLNPLIEQKEFIEKEWPQKCGDTLIIKGKLLTKTNYWICEFKKTKLQVSAQKIHIKEGSVQNFLLSKSYTNFKNKNKQSDLFIGTIWKQNCGDSCIVLKKVKEKTSKNEYLYEVDFINYSFKKIARKCHIQNGEVNNPLCPYFSKEENSLFNYIKSIYNREITTYQGKKEENYYEIDIYLPELKIGFEYNGSYWHNKKESENPGYHERKFKYFLSKGIIIFNIWDYFWFENYSINLRFHNLIVRPKAQQYVKNTIGAFTTKKLLQLI